MDSLIKISEIHRHGRYSPRILRRFPSKQFTSSSSSSTATKTEFKARLKLSQGQDQDGSVSVVPHPQHTRPVKNNGNTLRVIFPKPDIAPNSNSLTYATLIPLGTGTEIKVPLPLPLPAQPEPERHHQHQHKCPHCSYSSEKETELSVHYRDQHETLHVVPVPPQVNVKCPHPQCGKLLQDEQSLEQHVRDVHTEKYLPCRFCPYSHQDQAFLTRHLLNAHNHVEEQTENETEAQKKNSKKTCKPKTKRLRLVGLTLTQPELQLPPKPNKPFACKLCSFKAKAQFGLNAHVRIIHKTIKIKPFKFKCYICQDSFRLKERLFDHLRGHNRERPFKCSTSKCHYSTASSRSLSAHVRHTHPSGKEAALRTVKCPKCPGMFKNVAGVSSHLATIHKIILFRCYICSHEAVDRNLLEKHKKEMHPNPNPNKEKKQCPHCPKQVKTGQQLKQHIRSHTGETPYKCGMCEYASSNHSNLARHLKTCRRKVKERQIQD